MHSVSVSSAPLRPILLAPPVAGAEPVGACRSFFAGVYDVEANIAASADFVPAFTARATSAFVFSETLYPCVRLVRSAATIARGASDGFAIRLLQSGDVFGRAGDRAIKSRAGDELFVDLLQPFDVQVAAGDGGANDITLWIPRPRVLSSISDDAALHGFSLAGSSPSGALNGGALRLLAQQAEILAMTEMNALCDGLVELTARAIAPLLAQAAGYGGRPPLASFVSIRRHIDQHLRSPALSADSLAKTFGLSRASLYRLFEPAGGIATYIRNARLNRAYQDLVTPEFSNRRIGPGAYRLGFKNLSAFNRLFKETFVTSLSEARERALQDFVAPLPATTADQASSFGFWLGRLGAPSPSG